MKLRIENERLKKNYIAQKKKDGTQEYIRLKPKNTEQQIFFLEIMMLKNYVH